MFGLCTYATKPDKNCTTYTVQLLQYSVAKYKVQAERCVINIVRVLWRRALANTSVAVPARAMEPENNAPTDLQEGYKIDKYMYMYVYTTLTKYTSQQASWVQEVHTSIPAL